MRSLLFFSNKDNQGSRVLCEQVQQWCSKQKIDFTAQFFDITHVNEFSFAEECDRTVQKSQPDLILSAGGDGTLLKTARLFVNSQIPILPVCTGTLGFLMNLSTDHTLDALSEIHSQKTFDLEKRTMLTCNGQLLGLNEMLITAIQQPKMVSLAVHRSGELVTQFRGDGLMIATATGSTGYNLSAGGPILGPDSRDMVLTPLYPHSLTNRSIVMPLDKPLEITVNDHRFYQTHATADGQLSLSSKEGYLISQHDKYLPLLRTSYNQQSFFQTLREKMNWE